MYIFLKENKCYYFFQNKNSFDRNSHTIIYEIDIKPIYAINSNKFDVIQMQWHSLNCQSQEDKG